MDSMVSMILLQVALILLNAVFACAEIAVISINENKLAKLVESGDKRAIRVFKLTSQPAKFLATIQVAITLSGFLGSAFAADNFSETLVEFFMSVGVNLPYETLDTISVILITLVLSYFTLIFGELVPKRIAMRKAEALALGMSSLISTIAKLFAPIVWVLTASTNGVLRLLKIDPNAQDEEVSEEEIMMLVDAGSEKGVIDVEERMVIQNIFELDDITAEKIVTHRTEVRVLYLEESDEEWKSKIYSNRFSFFPVCEHSKDKVVGVLSTQDYFRLEDKSREMVLKKALRKPCFIPENKKADVILKEMRENGHYFAIVIDEYGGMTGILTANDLVELVLGEFEDSVD